MGLDIREKIPDFTNSVEANYDKLEDNHLYVSRKCFTTIHDRDIKYSHVLKVNNKFPLSCNDSIHPNVKDDIS